MYKIEIKLFCVHTTFTFYFILSTSIIKEDKNYKIKKKAMSFLKRLRDINAKKILGQWEELTEMSQLDSILEESTSQPVAIFKHSTSCGISHHVKTTLEEAWDFEAEDIKVYYLDLLAFRPISNEVAKKFDVIHQSPQFILIKGGEAVKNWSHYSISNKNIKQAI